jgi:hypothetical protein
VNDGSGGWILWELYWKVISIKIYSIIRRPGRQVLWRRRGEDSGRDGPRQAGRPMPGLIM